MKIGYFEKYPNYALGILYEKNIIDYIANLRRKARKQGKFRQRLFWNPENWQTLQNVVWATSCHPFTGEGGIRLENGGSFLGLRHFLKKK